MKRFTPRGRASLALFLAAAFLGAGEPSDPAAPAGAAVPGATQPSAAAKRVLIVTGVDYPGHKWRETTPVLAELLRKDPRLLVDVVEDPHQLASPTVAAYDVIVLHFMDWEVPAPGEEARKQLEALVKGGKGLVLVHFACGAFQDWPAFKDLAGRAWDPKLRGHDARGPFRVEIVTQEHPITRGLASFETDDELYTCLAGDRPVTLLAKARSKVDGKDYPMAFCFMYGSGRVFHSPLGHDVKAFRFPGVGELFRRGSAWAAGLAPVPAPKPAGN